MCVFRYEWIVSHTSQMPLPCLQSSVTQVSHLVLIVACFPSLAHLLLPAALQWNTTGLWRSVNSFIFFLPLSLSHILFALAAETVLHYFLTFSMYWIFLIVCSPWDQKAKTVKKTTPNLFKKILIPTQICSLSFNISIIFCFFYDILFNSSCVITPR